MEKISMDEILAQISLLIKPYFGRGQQPNYIPELASVPGSHFGMAVRTTDGGEYTVGDADTAFSIQSISKVLGLGLALNRLGDEVWCRVGKEPSGTPFNFLSQLEVERGVPRNPFINAGALVITDMLMNSANDPAALVCGFAGFLADAQLTIDSAVANSELVNAHKNRAIVHLLRAHGAITHDPESVMLAYCRQCALTMTCRQLVRAFEPLAMGGYSQVAGETIFTEKLTRRLNALLLTCGIYDSVGSFAYRVGLPAKSGIGGGIVAIVPGRATVAVWSPELDRFGTSIVGTAALEAFTRITNCSIF